MFWRQVGREEERRADGSLYERKESCVELQKGALKLGPAQGKEETLKGGC